jgi:VanZ family protein
LHQILFLKKSQLAIWLAPTWFIFTTILLCLPGSVFPKENWFDKIWLDKWIHIVLFSFMVFLWCWFVTARLNKRSNLLVQIFLYSVLYGIVMEFIQKFFIPNRSFDIGDIVADAIGSGIGLVCFNATSIKK